jgi:hypothetical protein
MKKYPITNELQHAIRVLFDEPSIPTGLLGDDLDSVPSSWIEKAFSPQTPPLERVRKFRGTLEKYVINMALEANELGEEEISRLRAEATATLVALRELMRHFPEAFT